MERGNPQEGFWSWWRWASEAATAKLGAAAVAANQKCHDVTLCVGPVVGVASFHGGRALLCGA